MAAKSKAIKIISIVLAVLIAVGACGAIAYFTNGFTTDFATFYVTMDGKDCMTDTRGVELPIYEATEVKVNYTFDFASSNATGYSLIIKPSGEVDFDFDVDGEPYSFSGVEDLSAGFEIEKGEESFTIKPKGDILNILSACFPDSAVTLDLADVEMTDSMLLEVISYNKTSSIKIYFSVASTVTGVTLSEEVIYFG